ncbi:MAG: alpha/beta fold hydrolase [Spirosomataceae bacterium]
MNYNTNPITIPATDGYPLGGLLLVPDQPKALVQLNGATAVPKEYYSAFAQFLATEGYAVCLFDYRGIGASKPASGLKHCDFEYLDWAQKDMTGVMAFLQQQFPSLPIILMGHSVGGQKFALMPTVNQAIGLLAVASSSGYWGFMPLGYRLRTHFFFEIVRPLTHWLYGYTAVKQFGLMEDLPARITNQWRAWCSVPDYFFDPKFYNDGPAKGWYHAIKFPIKVLWATDDKIANRQAVEVFWKHVKSEKGVSIEEMNPQSLGVKSIDHFGFFRKSFKATLWTKALSELDLFLQHHLAVRA